MKASVKWKAGEVAERGSTCKSNVIVYAKGVGMQGTFGGIGMK